MLGRRQAHDRLQRLRGPVSLHLVPRADLANTGDMVGARYERRHRDDVLELHAGADRMATMFFWAWSAS